MSHHLMCDGPSGTAQAAAATLTTHLSTHWSMAESEDESEYIERHHEQRHTGQGEQEEEAQRVDKMALPDWRLLVSLWVTNMY